MGLSAPKRRTKIGKDPNNTTWTRNTTSFGHRILTSQGWTPGSTLGATDAAHAAHFTAASTGHVRVLLKDDNLGLGAKRTGAGPNGGAERFGLDMYAGLLGRLNGKDDGALKKEEGARRDVQLRMWAEGRGGIRFVSAGFLVGDKIADPKADATAAKGKKRSADGAVKSAEPSVNKQSDATASAAPPVGKDEQSVEEPCSTDAKADRRRRKEERRLRRVARETRREERRARKAAKKRGTKSEITAAEPKTLAPGPAPRSSSPSSSSDSEAQPPAVVAEDEKTVDTVPAEVVAQVRPSVRRRYIQQKRMAGMDPQALKEIFMIKSGA